jgi:hypothetical protein
MLKHNLRTSTWVAAALLLAAAGGAALAWRAGLFGGRNTRLSSDRSASGLSDRFRYDLAELKKVDPALVKYHETATIPVGLKQARAVSVGPEDRIYVAGDRAVAVFEAKGTKRSEIALGDEPRCLAVAGPRHAFPGRVYVGMRKHVEVYDPARAPSPGWSRVAAWEDVSPSAVLTSIAVGQRDVFVADAGSRLVVRCDPSGKRLGEIGRRDPAKDVSGFVVPSPYFDVALTADDQLRIVNPGRFRIEWYTSEGTPQGYWGQSGVRIDRFCGCCNPANIAVLPDGRVVTAEKGLPRVKVYEADGTFFGVVAGPETFAPTLTALEETRDEHRLPVLDVAADSHGRILVLDPAAGKVRIFEAKEAKKGA